jgi:hypothetical protein
MDKLMYEGDGEVLICHADEEALMITEYFVDGGRDLDLYDVTRCKGPIVISSLITVDADQIVTV